RCGRATALRFPAGLSLAHLPSPLLGPPQLGAGALQLPLHGCILGLPNSAIIVVIPAVRAQAEGRQLDDAVHPPQQCAVMAHAEETAGPLLDEIVESCAASRV